MSRVLVSTEDPVLLSELTRQARSCGVRLIATNAQSVLDQARLNGPDLLILDTDRRVDSRLLLARLKQDLRTCGLRIAMLANDHDEKLHRFCREHRALHLQVKPLPSDYLETLINVRASSGWVALRSA